MAWHLWNETGREQLSSTDLASAVTILPIAASEQHGPHLPFGVDCILNSGLLGAARAAWGEPEQLSAIFELPLQPIGKSDEHFGFPGTLNLRPETMLALLGDIGDSLGRNGLRRLVIMSSHGGNSEVMALAARRMRIRHGMLVVATSWPRLGLPDNPFAGAIDADALSYDIHAGAIETSLMLHFAPELVDMDKAGDFENRARDIAQQNEVLRGTGGTGFAWASLDLSDSGAMGDPSPASAAAGERIAAHQAARFCTLLREIAAFDMSGFAPLGDA